MLVTKVGRRVPQCRTLLIVVCCSENTAEPHYQVREVYHQPEFY